MKFYKKIPTDAMVQNYKWHPGSFHYLRSVYCNAFFFVSIASRNSFGKLNSFLIP